MSLVDIWLRESELSLVDIWLRGSELSLVDIWLRGSELSLVDIWLRGSELSLVDIWPRTTPTRNYNMRPCYCQTDHLTYDETEGALIFPLIIDTPHLLKASHDCYNHYTLNVPRFPCSSRTHHLAAPLFHGRFRKAAFSLVTMAIHGKVSCFMLVQR